MAFCNCEEDQLPARMNFDQSEGMKFSKWVCYGRFQARVSVDWKNVKECIYSCPNQPMKPPLQLQVSSRNLECLSFSYHALRTWFRVPRVLEPAHQAGQPTSQILRIDLTTKRTRFTGLEALKHELLQLFYLILNAQVMTKNWTETSMMERPNSSRKIWMVKTDTGHNCLSTNIPLHHSLLCT